MLFAALTFYLGRSPRRAAPPCAEVHAAGACVPNLNLTGMTEGEIYAATLRCIALRFEAVSLAHQEKRDIEDAIELLLTVRGQPRRRLQEPIVKEEGLDL